MIDARIDLDDLDSPVVEDGRRTAFGASSIEIFASAQIQASMAWGSGEARFWVGDDADPCPDATSSRADLWTNHADVEGMALTLNWKDGRSSVEVSRTYAGTCPIYVSAVDKVIYLSWRYEKVVEPLTRRWPNLDACKIFLEHGSGQVREQMIAGTFMLWPGERLVFDGEDGLTFFTAPERGIPCATPVRNDAHICDAFFELTQIVMGKFLRRAANPLIEMSGGLDSTTLALAAGAITPGVHSYGLIQEGVIGVQQRVRRDEVINCADLIDYMHPAYGIPPFAGLDQLEECSFVAYDDNHRPACVSAIDAHPNGRFDLVFTGIGGDELMMEHTYTRADWEVPGTICGSSLVAATARADMFLRRGIWPVSPFCSFTLIDFCRALPAEYRSDRMLVKMNLARRGISDGFIFPRYGEHYGHTMRHEMAMIDFDELLSNSLVMSLGLVGASKLLEEARRAHYHGFSFRLMHDLWKVVKLERVLSRYIV